MIRLSKRENEMASKVVELYLRAIESKEVLPVDAEVAINIAIAEMWMLTQ